MLGELGTVEERPAGLERCPAGALDSQTMVVRGASRDDLLALPLPKSDRLRCRMLAGREAGGVPAADVWLLDSLETFRSDEG
jgi:hypothetical protein